MKYYNKLASLFIFFLVSILMLASCEENVTNNDDGNNNPINNEHSGTITTDETWPAGSVHTINGCLNVNGATLTIEQGATVKFTNNACLQINEGATLLVNGTSAQPVLFTGTEQQRGYWRYIYFKKGSSSSSKILNAIVEYGGGYSASSGIILINESLPQIENTVIRESSSNGITIDRDGRPVLTNNTITSNAGSPIAGYVENAHTIGAGDYTGNDKDYFLISDGTISQDITWENRGIPYRIDNNKTFHVKTSTLTLKPGVAIEMGSESRIELRDGGAINAEGTLADPILITGAEKQNGYWRYIWFYEGASNSTYFNHVTIEYGGGYGSNNYGTIELKSTSPTFHNTRINNSGGYGLAMDKNSFPTFGGNTITGSTNAPIKANFNNAHVIGAGIYNGNQKDYIDVLPESLTSDATLIPLTVPYRFSGNNYIENATLTIEPGTVIEMGSKARVEVKAAGGFNAVGTSSQKIHIKGAVPQKGYWDYLYFNTGSSNADNILDNVIIEHGGGYAASYGIINIKDASPTIRNSTVRSSPNWGIYIRGNTSNPVIENNAFSDNDGGDVYWP